MSSDDVSYPPDAGASTFLLTVRGKTVPATLEAARKLHNDTAGAPPSVAGARALGDLSHNVFAPVSDELGGELLFIDFWNSLAGLGVLQVQVTALDRAAEAFTAYTAATINRSRGHGIVSHSAWTRVPNPGEEPANEIVSIDLWSDPGEMSRYYDLSIGFEHLGPVFAGEPRTSTWMSAPGEWVEW